MKCKLSAFFILLICLALSFPSRSTAQISGEPITVGPLQKLKLVQVVMCEEIRVLRPQNEGVVFSIKGGEVYCFLDFDPVPEETTIRVSWFFKDERRRRVNLRLKPPRWSTYSRIQLRDADKGPWRLEVADAEGNILETLRFSITD